MASSPQTSAFARIGHLAAQRCVHEAFQWLHLQQQQIMRWQTEMTAIAAPPFGERPRAEWLAARFAELGLAQIEIDEVGNALAVYPASSGEPRCETGSPHPGAQSDRPVLLLSAHIDTVFPADTPLQPLLDGLRLYSPGACDNAAGVVALLAMAAAMRHAGISLPCDLLLAGNVGEEGEGDLRGVRHLYSASPWSRRIAAHIVLDGAGHEVVVTHALGSLRYQATVTGSGGHSWTDAGAPNPIVVLSRAIGRLADLDLPLSPRTTFNVGVIEGGSSVNAIPESASARFDLRSTDPEQLIRLEVELYRALEDAVLDANAALPSPSPVRGPHRPLRFSIEKIGDRPAGHLPAGAPILHALRAVDRHLGIRTEERVASTDANIPLSLGMPAVSIGAGGDGGATHTRAEWYDARGRDLGLRRILLLLLALAEETAKDRE